MLLLLGALGFLVLTAYGSQRATFELGTVGLRFHGDAYGRPIPWSAIDGAPQAPERFLAELQQRARRS